MLRRLGALPDYVKIMHANTPVNTWSLFPVIDYGLTVRGTIGMELPCFGIPTVTAGTGRYSGYGFTMDPQTRDAYRDCLLNLHAVPRLTAEQIELARGMPIGFSYIVRPALMSFRLCPARY